MSIAYASKFLWQRPQDRARLHYHRRRIARRAPAGDLQTRSHSAPCLVEISNSENLLNTYRWLNAHGGRAPGLDGIRFDDLSITEIAAILRRVSVAIRERRYRPYPSRRALIAKADGRHRELRIATLCDRVVATAVYAALSKTVDHCLLPGCFGFRSKRGVNDLFATLEQRMIRQERFFILSDDIRDAFPSVRVADAVADFRNIIEDEGVVWLIEVLLRGDVGPSRTIGIDQGSAISPAALNLRLSACLDRPYSVDPTNPPLLRYADNLVIPCLDGSEAELAISRVAQQLEAAGFELKGEGPAVDLRRYGTRKQLLGFVVTWQNERLAFQVSEVAWGKLRQSLGNAHLKANPNETARTVVRGWLNWLGPTYGGVEEDGVPNRVLDMAANLGFREICHVSVLALWREQAWQRWEATRRKVGAQIALL